MTEAGNPPVEWDIATGRNIVWSVELGNETYGRPVVAGDAVYVVPTTARHMNPDFQEHSGVLMAFPDDGWRVPLAGRGPESGARPAGVRAAFDDKCAVCGREPIVLCHRPVPTPFPRHAGFPRRRDTGPYREEVFQDNAAADIAWELDMCSAWESFRTKPPTAKCCLSATC